MSLSNPRILIVEDEPSQIELLRFNLAKQGFDVATEMDGEDGLIAAREDPPDLILLDWMLPGLSGVEVCRQLRRHRQTREIPIIMLTARAEENDKINGLDKGADDYITKPYSIKEVIARVRAALRRSAAAGAYENTLSAGAVEVDLEQHIVTCHGKELPLSAVEFRLLINLMQHPGRVFSRDQLLDKVWGISADIETRTVDVHIGRLRRALRPCGGNDIIRTVRGFGYSFNG